MVRRSWGKSIIRTVKINEDMTDIYMDLLSDEWFDEEKGKEYGF
jgi:hypothetical protein